MANTIPERISDRATYRRGRSSVTSNCNNLIRIQALTSQENENEAGTTEKYFVPSVLISNTMSLTPKIDEVAFVMKQNHCDIAAITETWLKESIPDVSVNIEDINYLEGTVSIKNMGVFAFT